MNTNSIMENTQDADSAFLRANVDQIMSSRASDMNF